MKKVLITLIFLTSLLLTGCNNEEKIVLKNTDPDQLFTSSQAILKKEIPTARYEVDLNNRILKGFVGNHVDYPSYIELRFTKHLDGTEVTVISPEDFPQKQQNLYHLLKTHHDNSRKLKIEKIQGRKESLPDKTQKRIELMKRKIKRMKDRLNEDY